MRVLGKFALLLICVCNARPLVAAVTRFEITDRQPYAEGRSIGERGAYQVLRGKVHFALDPAQPANQQIVDLELAPRNAQGQVEFWADLEILAPTDLSKASGSLLYDVNNRGNRIALGTFNGGADDFLLRQGLIVVWSGWIAEVLPGGNRLRLNAPLALENGNPLRGLVRAEIVTDKPQPRWTLSQWTNQGSYPPTERGLATAALTWRVREKDPRVPIPRSQWTLVQTPIEVDGQRGQLPLIELEVAGGLEPGYIYELVYEAEGSLVQGAGLSGIRDLLSCLKYDQTERNPLRLAEGRPAARYVLGFGTSQSGRCLRTFLHDGFNTDEQGRRVFDGVMPHVAGGGLGFFNHRFASPTRTNGQHEGHLYPADVFPFTYGDAQDPFTGQVDGILRKSRATGTVPKVMHTQSSSEYWHRSGSLVHTDPLSQRDAELPPEVRVYAFGGTQHGAGTGVPGERVNGQLPNNPSDYRPFMRGLLMALEAWVRDGREPPPSVYPRLSDKTLVGWRESDSGWQALPGIRYPEVIQQPELVDRGPEYASRRRTTIEPPLHRGDYVVRIPGYGPDNTELGVLLLPSVAVPVATFTSWNLRHRNVGAENELVGLAGAYVPLRRTQSERQGSGDPRPALLERYQDFSAYQRQFLSVAAQLVKDRYVLDEDLPRMEAAANGQKQLFEGQAEKGLKEVPASAIR